LEVPNTVVHPLVGQLSKPPVNRTVMLGHAKV
jgi:hypothetical protein